MILGGFDYLILPFLQTPTPKFNPLITVFRQVVKFLPQFRSRAPSSLDLKVSSSILPLVERYNRITVPFLSFQL